MSKVESWTLMLVGCAVIFYICKAAQAPWYASIILAFFWGFGFPRGR
jgi:hypothetical protein